MSTLAAVVGDDPQDLISWKSKIVSPKRPFARFHAKFWGVKEVTDTEGEQEDEGDMEIDNSTAEDGDIDPGCYVLDIDIEGVEDKIWVRTEYIRMFKYAEEFYAENTSPCLVITGQPGIGKSLWRWYALRRRCAQKKPVILYSDNTCWLFVEEGVFKQPTSFYAQFYNTVIWTLVDSMDNPSGPPIGLVTHGSQHFIIYTTSPTPSRWKKLHQSMERVVCVMNPWTKAEIHRAAPFRAPGVSLTAIDTIFNELGPIPRLCFGDEESLIEHRENLSTALHNLTLRNLEDFPTNGENLALDAVSDKIYMLLRRSDVDVDSVEVDVMTISPIIASKVALRLWALQHHELVHLFKCYSDFPSSSRLSGDVFEAYCHVIFSTRIDFDFVPMVRIGGRPKAKTPQWFSSHTEFRGSAQSEALELGVLRASALANGASLRIYPSRVVDCDSDEVAGGLYIEADVYYMLVKPNQLGIDSFILHDNNLYLLKMTVSDTDGISDKLLPFLISLKGLPPKSYWRFIFVKPPRKILACPIPDSAELWDLDLYSAEVEVK